MHNMVHVAEIMIQSKDMPKFMRCNPRSNTEPGGSKKDKPSRSHTTVLFLVTIQRNQIDII